MSARTYPRRRGSGGRQVGQIIPIAAIAFIVLCGIAGLAIDSSRNYLTKRDAQNAADFATLAAAKQMAKSGNLSGPPASNSTPVRVAHDFATINGFGTVFSTACDVASSTSFQSTWFDVSGPGCSATTGFTNKVSVRSPAIDVPGSPVPPVCQGQGQFSCLQVVITTRVNEIFTSILGINTSYVTVAASAHATLAGVLYNTPPPNALVLYQPQANCAGTALQCFTEANPASRTALSCLGGTDNCPTFWTRPGANIDVYGFDGALLSPSVDLTTLQANGDMVVGARTTVCDPYSAATCQSGRVVGLDGFAISSGAKTFCSAYGSGATTSIPCITTGQGTVQELDGNQASFLGPSFWSPNVSTAGLANCGGLILNGGPVTGSCADAQEPYVIKPGSYTHIVVNHGTYEFDQGLFDITGVAPVNSLTAAGYTADGIDHSQERANDFDLCTAGLPNSCQGLTAGIWIGHGGGSFGPYVSPVAAGCTTGTGAGTSGGGGDATIVSGSGSVFRFESASGGFVSTHEVSTLNLSGAGVGTLAAVGGSPLLFDLENNSFIHLDAQPAASNGFQGVVYQASSARAGGVELNPGMAAGTAALFGQILAYSFTTFGQPGTLDFRQAYGSGSVPGIATSGRNETSIISSVQLKAATGQPGFSTLTVNYTDEWAMDGYDAFVKVNNGVPIFFSQGIWSPPPSPGAPQPPPNNNPGDKFPASPSSVGSGSYVVKSSVPPDYVFNIPNSGNASIELSGGWVWGHQRDIAGAQTSTYTAQLSYTFPNPNGSYVAITVFLSDGDRCGDYALASYTFKSTGLPGGGTQNIGQVELVQ